MAPVATELVTLIQSGELVALKKIPLRKLEDGIPNSVLRYRVPCIDMYICLMKPPMMYREMKALQECEDSHHVCMDMQH